MPRRISAGRRFSKSPQQEEMQALQLMSKLPALLGAMGKGEGGSEATRQSRPDTVALLCALRPYLNERRRSMVDQVIRLHKLQALLQTVRTE